MASAKQKREIRKAAIAAMSPAKLKRYKRYRRRKRARGIGRIALAFFVLLAMALTTVYCGCYIMLLGPSQSFGDLLTVSLLETSALKFVPYLYYSDEQVEAIVARNSVELPTEDTDTSLIVIAPQTETEDGEEEDIQLVEINGATYNGYMLIVKDPSRVSVGTCSDTFSSGASGKELYQIAKRYNAVAAINGGGFPDSGGVGKGGTASGITFSQGKAMVKYNSDKHVTTVGFDSENRLLVGKTTYEEAVKKGVRDCVTFGPALIVNGKAMNVSGSGSGLNPRTAIGQRADGAVLMLVIDGRSANSIGASMKDLISIMQEYGAINACNLDGGSSSMMYYNGEYVNTGVHLTGSRNMPTAFIVQ